MLNAPQCTDEAVKLLKWYLDNAGADDYVLPSASVLREKMLDEGAKIPSMVKAHEWAYLIYYAKGWIKLGQTEVNGVKIYEGVGEVDIIDPPTIPTCTECDRDLSKSRQKEGIDICGHCEFLLHL